MSMVQAPWEENSKPGGPGGRRLLLWLRPQDEELSDYVDEVAEEKMVPRSAVARWLALEGLLVVRGRE